MALLHFPASLLRSSSSLRPISSSSTFRPKPISPDLPARDRIIEFGKHKGKMLGTLPSKYLTWVSKTLRARDFEEWAKLADEVLLDPVYRDRLEWESAERILSGEGGGPRASLSDSPVSDLLEISDRFGWDNEDKAGWARVDFDLLGTSKGGRIPRVAKVGERKSANGLRIGEMRSSGRDWGSTNERKDGTLGGDSRVSKRREMGSSERKSGFLDGDSNGLRIGEMGWRSRKDGILDVNSRVSKMEETDSLEKGSGISKGEIMGICEGRKVGFLRNGQRFFTREEEEEEGGVEMVVRGKREERRERRMLKRGEEMEKLRREVGVEEDGGRIDGEFMGRRRDLWNVKLVNPFPGRGSLL